MEKLDRAIKGVKCCLDGRYDCYGTSLKCPYTETEGNACTEVLLYDVLEMLVTYKESLKPVSVHYEERIDRLTGEYTERPCCECGRVLDRTELYCPKCGKKIKWM